MCMDMQHLQYGCAMCMVHPSPPSEVRQCERAGSVWACRVCPFQLQVYTMDVHSTVLSIASSVDVMSVPLFYSSVPCRVSISTVVQFLCRTDQSGTEMGKNDDAGSRPVPE